MNLDAIRDGIVTRLNTISGLRTHPRVPDALEPPAAFLSLNSISYDDTFEGGSTVVFDLVVCVAGWDGPRGQEKVDEYVNTTGSKSIRAAIVADPDIAGAAESVRVTGVSDMDRNITVAGSDYVGARFTVEVLAAP